MGSGKTLVASLKSLVWVLLVLASAASAAFGQATGSIVGSVTDASSARIPGVTVKLTNTATGLERSSTTNEAGAFVFSSLLPSDYEVTAEIAGFKKTVKRATVNAGRGVTVDFSMEVGEVAQTVSVTAEASAINLVDSKVDAIVDQAQISNLPLNGRSAYEMAKLVPGVKVTTVSNRNADNQISVAGNNPGATRYTVDGISVTEVKGGGGIAMNFANEAVQEFQVSINNNDPSIGISSGGAINIITRSGTNTLHGNFFGFFRDSEYAAFPGLSRPVLKPNPNNDPAIASFNETQQNPPLWRRQIGGILSGPIKKERLFWLASIDVSKQVASATFDTNSSDLAAFNRIASYPRKRLLQNYRLDWRATDKHSFFARFSRDSLTTRTSGNSNSPATWVSQDVFRDNHTYNAVAAWTSVWSPALVGDLRVGLTRWNIVRRGAPEAIQEAQQFAPALPRIGSTTVSGTNLIFGSEQNVGQNGLAVQPQVVSNFTYMRSKNTWKFGIAYTPVRYWEAQPANDPYRATLFNPTQARQAGIPVPASYTTLGDLLQLPISSVIVPVGKVVTYPFTYKAPGHDILWSPQVYLYLGDSLKATPRLTMNWSLGWTYDSVTAPNRDMPRPQSVARFFDKGKVTPPDDRKDRFSPSVGFAWDPFGGGKTVFRGGFGVYYATAASGENNVLTERALLAPVGNGYVSIPGTAITNPKTGTGTLSFGSAAANAADGIFRLSDFVNYVTPIRSQLERTIFTGTNQDFSVTNLDYFKGTTNAIADPDAYKTYSLQSMVGAQHQFGNDWLADGTFIYNVSNHTPYILDANRQFRPASLGGPVLRDWGAVNVVKNSGKANYRGLLLAVKKRMSPRYQLSAAYTLSSYKTTAGTLIDYDNIKTNYSYDAANRRHLLNVTATVDLPWGFQLALLSEAQSKAPFNVFLNGIDLNGDGTANDLVPGIPLNSVNMSTSAEDIRKAAANFNLTYAGKRDARGTVIQPINLPAGFRTGDTIITQDMRITKRISIRERFQVSLIAEAFNLFNIANLNYLAAAGNVYTSGFGQPGARLGNQFGSEGPRAFQFAARTSF
ncbi:MAG TPA: TonB-dependent receptor [Terriglobia bacterium]|nr:TonB-dependent receptor [Terriglobia bacterium]